MRKKKVELRRKRKELVAGHIRLEGRAPKIRRTLKPKSFSAAIAKAQKELRIRQADSVKAHATLRKYE